MLKHPLWLAVIGLLLTGGALVYVQSQRCRPLPKFPSDLAPKLTVGNAVQRLPASATSPPAANAPASAAPARAWPQAPAPAPAPDAPDVFLPAHTFLPEQMPSTGPMVQSMFPADRPAPAPTLSPLLGEFWTSSIFLEAKQKGDEHIFTSFNKKPDDDKPLTLSFNNKPGIGPQYLLMKSEDTTFLGRVASRFSQTYPGLSDEEHVSEVLLGCQLEHRLSRRNKVFSAVEYARNPADLTSHRIRTQAAWEVLLDPDENLSLRSSILESSDYAPNREQAKNVNYNLNLIWKF
jgi:hypothetical protein